MRQNIKRWAVGLAVILFVAGSALSIYRLLHRTDQELEMRVFEVNIALDQYPMPFSDPEAVRCPPALSDGETGTVHMRVTNTSSVSHTLSVDYGTCHLNLEPGQTTRTDCTVRAENVPDDYVIVHILPVDSNNYSIYSPRKPLCSIPVVNVGNLSGQTALIVTFLPGLLGMLLGAALWIAAGQVANRTLRTVTITGLLLAITVLLDVLVVSLLTAVSLRGDLLIGLTIGVALLMVVLVVQLVALGIIYGRRSEA
jgi:hypothetical protein